MPAPAFRSANTANEVTSNTTWVSNSYTLTAGDTLFVMFNAGYSSVATVSSVKWNTTETMTEVGKYTAGSTYRTCHVYRLTAGTSGAHTVTVVANQSCNIITGVVFAYSDVDTSTPVDGVVAEGSGSLVNTFSTTITSAVGDTTVLCALFDEGASDFSPINNGTSRFEGATTNAYMGIIDNVGAATATMGADLTSSTGGRVGFNLNAVGTGAPTITDAGDESYQNGETGIVITGTGFGASQGAGLVKISPTDNVNDASAVTQTVTSWADTSITITAVKGALALNTGLYLFVKENGGTSNASGRSVQFWEAGSPIVSYVRPIVFVNDIIIQY